LKNKDCKEESMTQVLLYIIGTSTTLASTKSHARKCVLEMPFFLD